jgi:hypothetical protein
VPTGIALVDVTAQACRAARENLIDDGALLPAPEGGRPTGQGLEVPLEDLGDLVSRSLAHLLEDDPLRAQRIERTTRLAHALRRHVRVDLSRPERAVTQEGLDHAQVRARLQSSGERWKWRAISATRVM